MNLSISNIAWETTQDAKVYKRMKDYGYLGLEIAPTRIFPESPYKYLAEAEKWSVKLKEEYGLTISSLQSICYGKNEKLFGSSEERNRLLCYMKQAIDFATAVGCKNLVFGCPRNRNLPEDADEWIAIGFFKELGDYAYKQGTVIGIEANPPIYQTNYINDTNSALELIRKVDSRGFLLNLDVGTIIQNREDIRELVENVTYINHVHVSEPCLKTIEKRELHKQLANLLNKEQYQGFISIEMGRTEDFSMIENVMRYVKEIFGEEKRDDL